MRPGLSNAYALDCRQHCILLHASQKRWADSSLTRMMWSGQQMDAGIRCQS